MSAIFDSEEKATKRLVRYGFCNKEFFNKIKNLKDIEKDKKIKGLSINEAKKLANEEIAEEANDSFLRTGYPKPKKRYKIIKESPSQSIEETYFWVLNHIKQEKNSISCMLFLKSFYNFYHIPSFYRLIWRLFSKVIDNLFYILRCLFFKLMD